MSETILITGASRGLGATITKHLLENNYNIIGVSRTETDFIKECLKDYPKSFRNIKFDLKESENIESELYKSEIGISTQISGFVNNAAIAYDDIITNLNLNALTDMFNINVFSPMLLTKSVLRNMILHNIKGSIIHISSISVHTGYKGLAMYASTKGAIEAFSKSLSREWGKRGIRSNCIVAGFMETDMSKSLNQEQKNKIYGRTSLGKPTDPKSVASTVEFLLRKDSDSITGQNIFVDSGTN